MKLDKVIVLMFFKTGKKDFLVFNDRKKCINYFKNEDNLKKLEEEQLYKYDIYYGTVTSSYEDK